MREHPVKRTYVVETPVLDPSVYLFRRRNKAFLEGKRKTPHLGHNSGYFVLLGSTITGVSIAVMCFTLLVVTQSTYQPHEYWPVACFLVFILVVLVTLLRMSFITYKAETTKGIVVAGTVLRSHDAFYSLKDPATVQIRIRYCFVSPNGIETVADTQSAKTHTNSKIAPLPGTPVRVWYTENGKPYLL